MTPADREHYKTNGYVVLRGVVDPSDLEALEGAFEHYASEYLKDYGLFGGMHSADYTKALADLAPVEEEDIYKSMRGSQNLEAFGFLPELIEPVGALVGYRSIKPKAARFRMDLPRDLRYLAVWHQDHAYVGGSIDTVTAWVPLQDVDWPMGPLLIAPKSHLFGPRPHTRIVGNRKCPEELNLSDLHAVQLRRGDVLLFHSLLLHSGQPNLSDRVRYSIQIRYEPID